MRDLTAEDLPALRGFCCADPETDWSIAIEDLVRHDLGDLIQAGAAQALGMFEGDELAAVLAWSAEEPDVVVVEVLAVDCRHRRRGHATAMKRELIMSAGRLGASAVVSLVRPENGAMLQINEGLGAVIALDTDEPGYLRCVIDPRTIG